MTYKSNYSDYKSRLFEDVMSYYAKHIDDLYPNSLKHMKFEDIHISIRFSSKFTEAQSFATRKKIVRGTTGGPRFNILIGTKDCSKKEALRTLAHEITHPSQYMSGFKEWSDRHFPSDAASEAEEYDRRHHEIPTEQEAELVEFLYVLKNDTLREAWKYYHAYYDHLKSFGARKFAKEAVKIGVDVERIRAFVKYLSEKR